MGVAATAGLAITVVAFVLAERTPLTAVDWVRLVVMALVITANWLWPLVIYRGKESEAVQLDEAVLVVLALLLPAGWSILAFVSGTCLAQLVRRRAPLKTAFNTGQLTIAVALAVAVSHAPRSALTGLDAR